MAPLVPGGVKKLQKITTKYDKVLRHSKFGAFYHNPKTVLWRVEDLAGHGGSKFKVYKEVGNRLERMADADEYGRYLRDKHKGPVGQYILLKDLKGVNR